MVAVTYRSSAGQRHRHTPAGSALTFWCVLMSGPFTSGCPAQCAALHYSMLMVFSSDLVLDTNLCSEFWLYTVETEETPAGLLQSKASFSLKVDTFLTGCLCRVSASPSAENSDRLLSDLNIISRSFLHAWDETSRHSNNPLDPVLTQKTLLSLHLELFCIWCYLHQEEVFFNWISK